MDNIFRYDICSEIVHVYLKRKFNLDIKPNTESINDKIFRYYWCENKNSEEPAEIIVDRFNDYSMAFNLYRKYDYGYCINDTKSIVALSANINKDHDEMYRTMVNFFISVHNDNKDVNDIMLDEKYVDFESLKFWELVNRSDLHDEIDLYPDKVRVKPKSEDPLFFEIVKFDYTDWNGSYDLVILNNFEDELNDVTVFLFNDNIKKAYLKMNYDTRVFKEMMKERRCM